MAPKRAALEDITNRPAKTAKTTKPDTATEAALRQITPQQAQETLDRLLNRYQDKSGQGYPAAVTDSRGCKVAQKGGNREDNGYIQIAPISAVGRLGSVNGVKKAKPAPQNAHRLVVVAHGSEEDKVKMLDEKWQASHLCHETKCISEDHIVVEPKERNELRKGCGKKLWVMEVQIGEEMKKIRSKWVCPCAGKKCIPKVLEGEVLS